MDAPLVRYDSGQEASRQGSEAGGQEAVQDDDWGLTLDWQVRVEFLVDKLDKKMVVSKKHENKTNNPLQSGLKQTTLF